MFFWDIGPIIDDRLKEKLLKPWKGAHSSHIRVCLSVRPSVHGLQDTLFGLGTLFWVELSLGHEKETLLKKYSFFLIPERLVVFCKVKKVSKKLYILELDYLSMIFKTFIPNYAELTFQMISGYLCWMSHVKCRECPNVTKSYWFALWPYQSHTACKWTYRGFFVCWPVFDVFLWG